MIPAFVGVVAFTDFGRQRIAVAVNIQRETIRAVATRACVAAAAPRVFLEFILYYHYVSIINVKNLEFGIRYILVYFKVYDTHAGIGINNPPIYKYIGGL